MQYLQEHPHRSGNTLCVTLFFMRCRYFCGEMILLGKTREQIYFEEKMIVLLCAHKMLHYPYILGRMPGEDCQPFWKKITFFFSLLLKYNSSQLTGLNQNVDSSKHLANQGYFMRTHTNSNTIQSASEQQSIHTQLKSNTKWTPASSWSCARAVHAFSVLKFTIKRNQQF